MWDAHAAVMLLGEKRNPSAREGKSAAHLLTFRFIFWRLKAQQGGGELALQTACECCLCQWVAGGQLGCPLAVWDCKMD